MTGITNGLYRIRLAASPSPLVGVTFGSTPVPPVVTNGASQIVCPIVFAQRQRHFVYLFNLRHLFLVS